MDALGKESLKVSEAYGRRDADANHPESELVDVVEGQSANEQGKHVQRELVQIAFELLSGRLRVAAEVTEVADELAYTMVSATVKRNIPHLPKTTFIKGRVIPAPTEAMNPAA